MRAFIGVPTTPYKYAFADMELADIPPGELSDYWLRARLNQKICGSIRRAGGIPIELLPTDSEEELFSLASRLDGFVFAGGEDIHPKFYGEEPNGAFTPYIERDIFEMRLFKKILDAGKPVLGICRGAQMINVALGGTLYQHLAGVKPEWGLHMGSDVMNGHVHTVEVLEPEFFRGFDGTDGKQMYVNSLHHQAVKELAPGLEPLAATGDGLVEAFRLPGYKHLAGVQWHPECLSEDSRHQAGLFEALIDSSR